MKQDLNHYAGCLLGGALGDALGARVEFMSFPEIAGAYGPAGYPGPAGDEELRITDDTQMTLFTAEGLLRAINRGRSRGIGYPAGMVHGAYLRWLATQGDYPDSEGAAPDGWLIGLKKLHVRRAPGNTCLTALRSGRIGTVEEPINNSKGCGGVMRAAPAGLVTGVPEGAFELGCRTAAITHGHPSGYLPAGLLAEMIRHIIRGASLQDALEAGLEVLRTREGHEETLAAVRRALILLEGRGSHVENIEAIGGGWVGEEALAIALYCCLASAGDLRGALLLAVNHSGDSDSTGAIAGNILGAFLGREALPREWLGRLELAREIEEVAADLQKGWQAGEDWRRKYPGSK